MAFGYNMALRNARLGLVRDAIDAGAGPGTITLYSSTRPATGGAVTSQTVLAVGTFASPCGSVASGQMALDTITYTNGMAAGFATWARIEDGSGAFVADCSVGVAATASDVVLADNYINVDIPITHVSAVLAAGNP